MKDDLKRLVEATNKQLKEEFGSDEGYATTRHAFIQGTSTTQNGEEFKVVIDLKIPLDNPDATGYVIVKSYNPNMKNDPNVEQDVKTLLRDGGLQHSDDITFKTSQFKNNIHSNIYGAGEQLSQEIRNNLQTN